MLPTGKVNSKEVYMAETANRWETIREGANEVERLIGQKNYNLAMIKARQTLEIMVRALAERCGLEYRELRQTIDELDKYGVLSDTSVEHYHTIRKIGNKAMHEEYDNPKGANVAYHLLSQELYTFAHDYGSQRAVRKVRSSSSGGREDDMRRTGRKGRRRTSGVREIIFIAVAVILVVLLVFGIVKFIGSNKKKETETQPETEMQITVETIAQIPETVPEPVTEAPQEAPKQYVINAAAVNIREAPNTDCRIITQLHQDDPITVIEEVDVEWVKIDLDGTEAYVNRQYIRELSTDEQIQGEETGETQP